MADISISQLAALTGFDRRTVSARLVNLDYKEGPDRAHLYESEDALRKLYAPDREEAGSLEEAKKEQALSSAELNRLKAEELRKTRIPIEIVRAVWDSGIQSFGATLKAARGVVLTQEKINELLQIMQDSKLPLKW
jgi:hypothetical protein